MDKAILEVLTGSVMQVGQQLQYKHALSNTQPARQSINQINILLFAFYT